MIHSIPSYCYTVSWIIAVINKMKWMSLLGSKQFHKHKSRTVAPYVSIWLCGGHMLLIVNPDLWDLMYSAVRWRVELSEYEGVCDDDQQRALLVVQQV